MMSLRIYCTSLDPISGSCSLILELPSGCSIVVFSLSSSFAALPLEDKV